MYAPQRRMKHTTCTPLFVAAVISIASMLASCGRTKQWHMAEGSVWNTTYRITYRAADNLNDSIIGVMQAVERSLSPFIHTSLISRLNRNETDSTDAMIDSVFAVSKRVNRWSDGRFDPTVSPLVNLWGFGYDKNARLVIESDTAFSVPQEIIDSALLLVGIDRCEIHNGRMHKKHPATTFNFSSVTKGFACDMISEMLLRNAAHDHMVEIGGELAVSGDNPQGKRWRIQIDAPTESGTAGHVRLKTTALSEGGIATSGNYRNYHDTANYGRLGHIIDPVTGAPVRTTVASATVTAPTCALADALATACMASPPQKAMEMIHRCRDAECLLVICDGDSMRIEATPGFRYEE